MKISLKALKKIINENINKKILTEEIRLSDDSLDDQIDSLLIGFESESVVDDFGEPSPEQYQESNFLDRFMNKVLLEKEEMNQNEKEPPKEDLTTDSSAVQSNQPLAPPKQKINIDQFAKKVGRLIKNHQNLLDPVTVIYIRAKNLLTKNYNEETVEEFENTLTSQFGISLEDNEDMPPTPPPAKGAGPSTTP